MSNFFVLSLNQQLQSRNSWIHNYQYNQSTESNKINTIAIYKLILKRNILQNSILVFTALALANLSQILIYDNDLYQNNFLLTLVGNTISIKKFLFQNNLNYFGKIIYLESHNLILGDEIIFKNCTFISQNKTNQDKVLHIFSFNESLIKNLYFIDIIKSVSLFEQHTYSGQFDNTQMVNVEIHQTIDFLILIIYKYEARNKIHNIVSFHNLLLDNILEKQLPRKDMLSNCSIILITVRKFQLSNFFASNIIIEYSNLITSQEGEQFSIKNFKACKIKSINLIYSIVSNDFDQIYLQQIQVSQNLILIQPFNALRQNIQNFQICESISLQGLIVFDFPRNQEQNSILLCNFIIEEITSEYFLLINSRQAIINFKNIRLTESKLKQIVMSLDHANQFNIQFFKVQNVLFELEEYFCFMIFSNKILLLDILFTRNNNFSLMIISKEFQINNLMFLNSQIIFIKIETKDRRLNYHIINNIHLINNIYSQTNLKGPAFLQFKNDLVFINGLNIHNNTVTNDSILLSIQSKFIIYSSFTNNKCGQYCIEVQGNSQIKFQQIIIFQNLVKSKSPLKIDYSSKVINFNYQQEIKNQLAIQINEKKIIKDFRLKQLLTLPSGQKLVNYKIIDHQNIKLEQWIQNISIINNNNSISGLIIGSFSIQVFEYDKINNKIVSDLSQFQNFKIFQQSVDQYGLNQFQIIFSPYNLNILMIEIQKMDDSILKLTIFAKTQLCQIGEILIKNQCLVCSSELNIYSLKQKSNFCQIVDEQIISNHISGAIQLRKGYWRPYIYNSFIEQCDSKIDKCNGGWHTGDISCQIGYIGAICNSCDIYNTRGNGYYLYELNQCRICGEFRLCIRLILQLNSNVQNYKKLILQRLVNYRNFHILAKYISDIPSLIFTILIGNLAILKFIIQDEIDLPDILTIFTNPIIIEQNSFLCIQKFTNLDYNYWLYYFKLIIPILTYNMFVFLMVVTLKRQNIIKTYFLFPIISLFLTQGPTLLVLQLFILIRFIQQSLYTTYSNIKFTNFDFSIRFYSAVHQHNLKYIILPIILVLNVILPFTIMILIKRYARDIFKDKFIQLGNFILPFKSNYQELFNYYKNSLLLLLLSLNDKQLSYSNKPIIITIIMYISLKNEIYKIKPLSQIATKSGINLICILLFQYFQKQLVFLSQANVLLILTLLFITQQSNQYLKMLLHQNKLQIFELLRNYKLILKYLGFKKYIQSIEYWKLIKQNHKLLAQQKQWLQNSNKEQSINDIILQTVKTQMTNNTLLEIEMVQL